MTKIEDLYEPFTIEDVYTKEQVTAEITVVLERLLESSEYLLGGNANKHVEAIRVEAIRTELDKLKGGDL